MFQNENNSFSVIDRITYAFSQDVYNAKIHLAIDEFQVFLE
jgi:hypothetical protein